MRKLFISTTVVSLLAALVVGAVLAWTGTGTGNFNSSAGSISVALYSVDATGNQVYPTGNPIAVLEGGIQNNTPANPGISVQVTGGSVSVNSPGGCSLSGDVVVLDSSFVGPGGANADNLWRARLTMGTGAPDGCQGATINYDVTVNVGT